MTILNGIEHFQLEEWGEIALENGQKSKNIIVGKYPEPLRIYYFNLANNRLPD